MCMKVLELESNSRYCIIVVIIVIIIITSIIIVPTTSSYMALQPMLGLGFLTFRNLILQHWDRGFESC
jgi:hypothetical protein